MAMIQQTSSLTAASSTLPSVTAPPLRPITTTSPWSTYGVPKIPLSSLDARVGCNSPVKREDEQLAAMKYLLVPLLKMVEEHIVAHVDARFDEQQQSLHVLLGQQDNLQEKMQQMRQEHNDFKKSVGGAQHFQGAMTAIAQEAALANAGPTGRPPMPRNGTAEVPVLNAKEIEEHLAAQQHAAVSRLLSNTLQAKSLSCSGSLPGSPRHSESDHSESDCQTDLGLPTADHFAKFIFEQCPTISYADFELLVGQFRMDFELLVGHLLSKAATMKDVTDMRRYITVELLGLEQRLSNTLGA